jgi:hypothetical protein
VPGELTKQIPVSFRGVIQIARHGLPRRALGLADIRRRNGENVLPRLPLRVLRDASKRRRKARMSIAAARGAAAALFAAARFPQRKRLAIAPSLQSLFRRKPRGVVRRGEFSRARHHRAKTRWSMLTCRCINGSFLVCVEFAWIAGSSPAMTKWTYVLAALSNFIPPRASGEGGPRVCAVGGALRVVETPPPPRCAWSSSPASQGRMQSNPVLAARLNAPELCQAIPTPHHHRTKTR